MRELNIEQHLQRRCKRARITTLCIKGEALGKGWPDRIVLACWRQVAFIELKRPLRFRASRQRFVRALLKSLGFYCEFLDSKEKVDEFMDYFEGQCTKPHHTAQEILAWDE